MYIKFKLVKYLLTFIVLFNLTTNAIVSTENEVSVTECLNTENESSNNTFENDLEGGKYIRIGGKTRNHFRSLIADIFPKKSKSYWIEDSVDKRTIQTEMPNISLKTDVKIVATTMPEENSAATVASFSSESSSESSQSNIISNLEKTEEDLNATFQVHKDNIGDAGDTKFENKTNIVAVGATAEDIPSFREWAEKHLAAEEKERGDENNTNAMGNGKVPKIRNKNYASPDCGAKLLNTNPEAKAAGSFLSSSRDEYLLSPCNSKIWFVVELCEAVQLKKIELANFELFSSSPREFSVSISDRFPSRDWSLIGQFIAKDEKSVQSFSVKPCLFTKYIKVEFHSHYGHEHFCPISLFRVYGTSEFEVLETVDSNDVLGVGISESDEAEQNAINDDLYDDDVIEPIMNESDSKRAKTVEPSSNLFGSARDVVINIVKKAAEALVNVPQQNRSNAVVNHSTNVSDIYEPQSTPPACVTLKYAISCVNCEQSFFDRVYHLISCHLRELEHMLLNNFVRVSLLRSNVCASLNWSSNRYIVQLLAGEVVSALCHLLAIETGTAEENITMSALDKRVPYLSADSAAAGNASIRGFADENLVSGVETDSFSNIETPGGIVPSHLSPATKFTQHSRVTNAVPFTSTDIKLTKVSIDDRVPVDSGPVAAHIKPTKTVSLESQHPVRVDASVPSAGSSSVPFVPPPVENVDHHRAKVLRVEDDDTSNKDTGAGLEHGHGAEISDDSPIDSLISEWEKTEGVQPAQSSTTAPSKPIAQKESVFVRLANRIKSLERNMSLSGQYLEELSRRYKKQVEDMQRVLTEAAEDRQKSVARETKLSQEVTTLNHHVAELTAAVESLLAEREGWSQKAIMVGEHSLIIFIEVAIFLLIVCVCRGIPSVEISKRKFSLEWNRGKTRLEDEKNAPSVALKRRQSFNDLTANAKPVAKRRPSEEALKIDGATHQDLLIYEPHRGSKTGRKRRKRKELLLKSNANAINLETGGDTLPKKKAHLGSMNAPLSRSASASEIDDHYWARSVECNGATGGGRAALASTSVNGGGHHRNGGDFKENVASPDDKEWPAYLQTATAVRTKRLSTTKFNGSSRAVLSPVYDVSSDPDSSVPSTPVKEKKINGLKKIVKKFF